MLITHNNITHLAHAAIVEQMPSNPFRHMTYDQCLIASWQFSFELSADLPMKAKAYNSYKKTTIEVETPVWIKEEVLNQIKN